MSVKLRVTNLGAIKEANIEISGLTVFVGPNGTGKSYLAKVIYGLQRYETLTFSYFANKDQFNQILFGKVFSSVDDIIFELQNLTLEALNRAILPLANLHAELFRERLGEYFNDDSELFKKTTISFQDTGSLSEEQFRAFIDPLISKVFSLQNHSSYPFEQALWRIYWHIFWNFGGGFADYFPAARSNFMLTYKALYRARADEHVGLESRGDMPLIVGLGSKIRKTGTLLRFDKPTEDFISNIYDLNIGQLSDLSPLADTLQSQLYGEDKLVVQQTEGALPDFRYQVNNSDSKLRLHLSSSMVTETSPLFIGFRHWVQPNSLVIIDEPESHLHPEAQRKLVNGLCEAVNQGLQLILITHSPYILSCVNNLIKFGNLIKHLPDNEEIAKLKSEHPDMVAIEKEVHAYHFGEDGLVKDIVKNSGLIDEAEFTEPFNRINEIYETMRDIEWDNR